MTLTPDPDSARHAFIETRRTLVHQAETVADDRAQGTLSAAALDRLVLDVEAYQNARRAFILLIPPGT